MRKYIVVLLSILISVLSVSVILLIGCSFPKKPNDIPPAKTNPETITAVKASSLVVGQSTDESELSGEFSVDGKLSFADDEYILTHNGSISREWKFVPVDTDKYNNLEGSVKIEVFNYKLSFEENGGFEIEDVYFNDSYTLESKPITAKNEYRFDGWSIVEDSNEYIDYPLTVKTSTTLYAGYTFHTADKLHYYVIPEQGETEYINNVPVVNKCYVKQNDDNVDPSIKNYVPDAYDPITEPRAGSISGEVIIADMYDDAFVTNLGGFFGSGITKFTFNNFIVEIGFGDFAFCLNLDLSEFEIPSTVRYLASDVFAGTSLKEITVPSTVNALGDAFEYAYELESVIFEDGDTECRIDRAEVFRSCQSLRNVVLGNRIKNIDKAFMYCSALESITIPTNVEKIGHSAFMWCTSLKNVVIEGEGLKTVEDYAFTNCLSLQEIKIPAQTKISPLAFFGAESLENIDITDEQITAMAHDLHEGYIGDADNFKVNITRSEQYGGTNFSGEYVADTEEINLCFDKFSIEVLNVLAHEFFHHYQYVLNYGLNEENFYTVPVFSAPYLSFSIYGNMPVYIVANPNYNYEGYIKYYESYTNSFINGVTYILIDRAYMDNNWSNYIELLPDESNYEEYWNQTYEKDARTFAFYISGVNYA